MDSDLHGQVPQDLSGSRVLLAEDDHLVAEHLRGFLVREGMHVDLVYSVAALKCAQLSAYDLLVLDLNMRDGETVEAFAEIEASGAPVLFHTGRARDARLLAHFPGAYWVEKPSAEADVLAACRATIGR